ncbi:hypothetical protein I6U48_16525 [Clostridium sp. PL3]|uniref:Uncharacterized protein n=1 Tax=Clostridium thailandense TaxID=2794346 RepID=A0A949U1C8_9CLOT|nr:hypothetical protein [Clostridium thailandense]MBV7274499.1 hypothetical protein [Clostridium thailandense]
MIGAKNEISKFIRRIKKNSIEKTALIILLDEMNSSMEDLTNSVVNYLKEQKKSCKIISKGIKNEPILLISGNKYTLLKKDISFGTNLTSFQRIILIPLE